VSISERVRAENQNEQEGNYKNDVMIDKYLVVLFETSLHFSAQDIFSEKLKIKKILT
jgi:hypothetical protein